MAHVKMHNNNCSDLLTLFVAFELKNPAKRQLRQRQTNKPRSRWRKKKENGQTMTVKEKAFKMSEDREHWALSRINCISIQVYITKFEGLHALAIVMNAFSTSYKSAIETLSTL